MSRVVLLGASNVTLGFGVLTRLLRAGFQGPLDVRAALGHGRSYGVWSTVGFRSLPGIVSCRLWDGLHRAEPARTFALLTDVGNDLMYGFLPEQISGWVETCLDRLVEIEARIVVTRLPIASVMRLGPLRYHATRMSFFPRHRPITWPEMLGRVRELDDRVAEAAAARGAAVVTPLGEWYGFDPIHIRWTKRTGVWGQVLDCWPEFRCPAGRPDAPALPLLGRFPEHFRLFGRDRETRQPVVVRPGVTLSLY